MMILLFPKMVYLFQWNIFIQMKNIMQSTNGEQNTMDSIGMSESKNRICRTFVKEFGLGWIKRAIQNIVMLVFL